MSREKQMARGGRKSHLDGDEGSEKRALSCPELVTAGSAVKQEQKPDSSSDRWHNDPELARMINERLAAGSD